MAVGDTIGGGGFNKGFGKTLSAELGQPAPYNEPYAMRAMQGLPGITKGASVTAFRGSNTILGGGWAERRAARRLGAGILPSTRRAARAGWAAETGTIRGAIRNNNLLTSRTWTRYASQGLFFDDAYTPMGFVSEHINKMAGKGRLGGTLQQWAGGAEAEKPLLMKGGMLSQISAAEQAGRAGSTMNTKWLESYLTKGNVSFTAAEMGNPAMRRQLILESMRGPVGQYVGGYMSSLRGGAAGLAHANPLLPEIGEHVAPAGLFRTGAARSAKALEMGFGKDWAAKTAGKITMKEGAAAIRGAAGKAAEGAAARGIEGFAAKKLAMAGGAEVAAGLGLRAAAMYVPYLNIAVAAWTAYDLAKALVPRIPTMLAETYTSYTGWNNKAMFGAGFKMNEAGMTSRSRGVMAIQNSRLNARSILGSEAGGMAAYYG